MPAISLSDRRCIATCRAGDRRLPWAAAGQAGQAARTVARKLSTSRVRSFDPRDNSPAAARTCSSVEPVCSTATFTWPMVAETFSVPRAAPAIVCAISWVAACCCSAAYSTPSRACPRAHTDPRASTCPRTSGGTCTCAPTRACPTCPSAYPTS